MLNGELEEKSKEANALDSKVKNLKENVSSKTKQIKELEKEVIYILKKGVCEEKYPENSTVKFTFFLNMNILV